MCHLILLMPIIALLVFWVFPLLIVGPVYAFVFVLSLAFYIAVFRMLCKPVETGREGIMHASGVVERVTGDKISVRINGEHWIARCAGEQLAPGDPVEVVSIEGLTLGVTRGRNYRGSDASRPRRGHFGLGIFRHSSGLFQDLATLPERGSNAQLALVRPGVKPPKPEPSTVDVSAGNIPAVRKRWLEFLGPGRIDLRIDLSKLRDPVAQSELIWERAVD
jgi:membrane protein implicated in regulation of membrane protease activity